VEQRVSLITLGVGDLARARRFYEALGWRGQEVQQTVFFQAGGQAVVLWGRDELASDAGIADDGAAFGGIVLAHNVRARAEVDDVLQRAEAAGATVVREARETSYGGYAGCFRDPDGHTWEIAWNPGFPLDERGDLTVPTLTEEQGQGAEHVPVTFDSCEHVEGPFFHGTKIAFGVGDLVVPGHGSNFHDGRTSNHVYFSALIEPAVWGAELAVALSEDDAREHVYVVEPTGPFEDDPNLTNKRFPGNVTRSYRTRHPMRVVGEVDTWERHPPEVLQQMLDSIAQLRAQGLDVVED
jgi:catechol 2,3-dioxygenase-like lactoylglutathione lyase family enzyme